MLFRTLILRAAALPPVKALVTRSRLFRGMVHRFVAGESIEEAVLVAEGLAERCFNVSLDLLGENVATVEEADHEREKYIALIDRIGQSAHRDKVNVSIKLTALGLDQGEDVAERNFRTLLEAAKRYGMFVRADMEDSRYTEQTVAMIERVFPDYPETGTVLQSMMKRFDDDVERMVRLGARVRVVKGAYLEPPEVAHREKSVVDLNYVRAAKRLLEHGRYPALATHDERIIAEIKAFVAEKGIDKASFEWQMLFGIRRDLQEQLRQEGYNVRVYVPFGESWYPYFSRRLAERPANLLFIAKSLAHR